MFFVILMEVCTFLVKENNGPNPSPIDLDNRWTLTPVYVLVREYLIFLRNAFHLTVLP